MLTRAKSFPALSLILAAFLAWPANTPLFAHRESALVGKAGPKGRDARGASIGRADRGPDGRWSDLSLDSGDREESDGWDGPSLPPVEVDVFRFGLPSLVRSPLAGRSVDRIGGPGGAWRTPILRC